MNTENNHKFWSESLAGLKNNPVFAMSLGSKELFHSNFLAFIFMHKSAGNLRKWLYAKAVEETDKTIEFDICFREKSNFDLLFKIKGEEKFILIENKFKSLPDSEQLKKYSEKLQEKEIENKSGNKVKYKGIDSGFKKEDKRHSKLYINTGNTCCFILSPKITALKQKVKKWKECFYDDLISEIEKISFPKELQQIVDFYCAFTKSILRAMGEFIEKSFPGNIDKVI